MLNIQATILFSIMTLALGACSTFVPAPLGGNDFSDVTPHMAQDSPEVQGQRVRWGGTIAKVSPEKNHTCFQVVSHPLDYSAQPEEDDRTNGRFIACAPGFYDPEVYAVKREITVIGTLQAPTIGSIGNYKYIFPNVDVEILYLWPKPSPMASIPAYEFGPNPFMYQANPWLMDPMDPMDPMNPLGPMEPMGMPW